MTAEEAQQKLEALQQRLDELMQRYDAVSTAATRTTDSLAVVQARKTDCAELEAQLAALMTERDALLAEIDLGISKAKAQQN